MKRLQSLSYKTLFTILFLALAGIVFFLKIGGKTQKVSAAWWDEMWHYRKAISITNSTGSNQTNSQIKILDNYDLSALVTAGKIQSDLDDLRFTDINGNLISYWIEDATNSSVDVWGLIPSINTSATTIFMYYGNSSAQSSNNESWVVDIGGNISYLNGYRIHAFTSNGQYTNLTDKKIDVLVVAGGGGGAYRHGAGGGAGGLIYRESFSINDNAFVTVGTGGSGGISSLPTPTSGGNSIFDTLTAIGGGRAGLWDGDRSGVTGGSGGGSCSVYNAPGTLGQGNAGGNGYNNTSPYNWGGGGGAGELGYNGTATLNGDGGNGLYYGDKFGNIYGENGWFAGGGGGGGHAPAATRQSLGGTGGGGKGGIPGTDSPGQDGITNTGGGGGGATSPGGGSSKGGNGGSGIVLIRYKSTVNTPSDISINPFSTEELSPAPIAYWKFDEGSGTTAYDSTSNQNNGTISGATWTDESQCISGKCLSFNSTQIQSNDFPYLEKFTLAAWIKVNSSSSDYRTIINKETTMNNRNFWLAIEEGTNVLSLRFSRSGSSTTWLGITNLADNQWHFVSASYDNTSVNLYVDGKIETKSNATGSPNTGTATINIGGYSGYRYFSGLIDDLKIYPYARTADQIKQDYNSRGSLSGAGVNLGVQSNTAPSLKSSLIAHYKFDEGSGTIAYNSGKAIGSNGTLLNSPVWTVGKTDKGLQFLNSGSQPVQPVRIPGTGELENVTDSSYTFSAWIKPSNSNTLQFAVTRPGYHTGILYDSNQKIGFDIWNNTPTKFGIVSTHSYIPNNWYHVVGIVDDVNKIVKIYINGKLDGSTSYSGLLRDYGTTNYLIGSALDSGVCTDSVRYCFTGLIDEIKIYNRALTDEEIKQDYNAGSAIQFGSTSQSIGGTTTSLEYCIPGDTSYCAPPIAEWKMDEGVGTSIVDTSGNNNTGTLGTGNSAPIWTQGKIGKAMSFNKSSNNYINANSALIPNNDFTFSSWVNLDNVSITGNDNNDSYTIASQDGDNFTIYAATTYGSANMRIRVITNPSPYTIFIGPDIRGQGWQYITVTRKNNDWNLYINGIGYTSVTTSRTITTSANTLIGSSSNSGRYFQGLIDHVKIYNYARTPAQIAYDYNKGGPVGWWKFDECQGNIAYDWSGIGNTGVINIGTSGTQNSLGTCAVGTSAAWTNGASGKINSSLNFDGDDDYINILNNPTLNLANNNYSISIWFKSALSMTDNPGMILQRYTGGAPGAGYWIAIQSNKVYFENRADGGDHLGITSNSSYNDHLWHQVIITVDTITKTGKMYIDGNYIKSDTYSGNILNNNANMTLGGHGINYSFNGQIDDVRIYNYALTDEQIKQVYNGGAVNFN